jgi:hypothetical protein
MTETKLITRGKQRIIVITKEIHLDTIFSQSGLSQDNVKLTVKNTFNLERVKIIPKAFLKINE